MNDKTKLIVGIVLAVVIIWAILAFVKSPDANATVSLVTICHKQDQPHITIQVAPQAVLAHLAHGDSLGACPTPSPTPSVSPTATPTPSVDPTPTPTPSVDPTPSVEPTEAPKEEEVNEESTGRPSETDCANLDALTEEQALNDCGESKVTPTPEVTEVTEITTTQDQPDLSAEFKSMPQTGPSIFAWF